MNALPSELWADLVGKSYKHLGRGPDCFDCYGLLVEMMHRQGIEIEDVYYADSLHARATTIQAKLQTSWQRCEDRPGAALVFGRRGLSTHCGVAIDHDRFIHASEDYDTTLISFLSRGLPSFQSQLIGSYEYRV